MNEVTKIHLGRQAFNISVAAHKALRAYLDAIEKQVGDKDVAEEVELRMAELLSERGVHGDKVILIKDVDYLKKQLGDPKEFNDNAEEGALQTYSETKKLFRDPDNAKLAGVAAGLSKYTGISVLLIRILFILGIFAWGGSILVYIALWLLVPEARTSSEKLQMAGQPVTVESLKEVVERADIKGTAQRANKTLAEAINRIFYLLVKLIGIGLVIIGLGFATALLAGGLYLMLHGNVIMDGLFPVGLKEHLLVYIAVAVGAMIALFIILFGLAVFRRKWPIRGWLTGVLVGLTIIGVVSGLALGGDAAPRVRDRYNANIHTSIRPVQPFTTVNATLSDGVDINYQVSNTYSVSLKYYGNPDLSKIKTTVSNGVLSIDSQQFDWQRHCSTFCLPDTYDMHITVSSPNQPQFDWPTGEIKTFPGSMHYHPISN